MPLRTTDRHTLNSVTWPASISATKCSACTAQVPQRSQPESACQVWGSLTAFCWRGYRASSMAPKLKLPSIGRSSKPRLLQVSSEDPNWALSLHKLPRRCPQQPELRVQFSVCSFLKCLWKLGSRAVACLKLWKQLQSCFCSVSAVLKQHPPRENTTQPLITKKVIKKSKRIVSGFELNI